MSGEDINDEDYVEVTGTSMSGEDINDEDYVEVTGTSISNEDINDEDYVEVTGTSMSDEDNSLEDDVESSVENDCVEDVGASGMVNTGVDNAEDEHFDNEASDRRLRHQNPTQETSKESESKENTKDGERFKDERNDLLTGRSQDEVVVNNVNISAYRETTSATNKQSVNVKFKDSCCSEQMELLALSEETNEVQAKSSPQKSLLVLVFPNSSESKRKKMRKSINQFFIDKQTSGIEIGSLHCFYGRTRNTVFVYALPYIGTVVPVPFEARYEHFRIRTFGHAADLNLEQGVVMLLARVGFFCDINGSVVCFSCAHIVTPRSLNQGLHHLRRILQNHTCPMHGNVPISMYGIACDWLLGSASAITPSGQPYQGHGVGQQNRLQPCIPYHMIVTSLTSFNQQYRLLPVNNVSLGNEEQGCIGRSSNEVIEQERETPEGAIIGASAEGVSVQGGQPASYVSGHNAGRTSQQDNTTQHNAMPETSRTCIANHYTHGRKKPSLSGEQDREQCAWSQMETDKPGREHVTENPYRALDAVESQINGLHVLDSDLGRNVTQMGFRMQDIKEAVRRLLNARETVDLDSILRELKSIGAQSSRLA